MWQGDAIRICALRQRFWIPPCNLESRRCNPHLCAEAKNRIRWYVVAELDAIRICALRQSFNAGDLIPFMVDAIRICALRQSGHVKSLRTFIIDAIRICALRQRAKNSVNDILRADAIRICALRQSLNHRQKYLCAKRCNPHLCAEAKSAADEHRHAAEDAIRICALQQ